jgi:3-oxoadipate enol-lactonase
MSTVDLAYASHGTGAPLVFLHAIGYDRRMWERLLPHLPPTRRVVRVDLRGHGKSPAPAGPYSMEMLADDCAALAEALGAGAIDLVGLSLGGMVAQAFAIRHPKRLRRLVIANTSSGYGPEAKAIWEDRKRLVREGGMRAVRPLVEERGFGEPFRKAHPDVVAKTVDAVMECPPEGYIGCCDAIAALDLKARLRQITAPTLAIAGSLDGGTPPAMVRGIADAIPGARYAQIEGAGHISAVEQPAEFARLVTAFVET